MTAAYPDVLPSFAATPFKSKAHNRIQRSAFGNGYVRQRRTIDKAPVYYSVSVTYTDDELAIFEAWREFDLQDVGWFTVKMLLPTGLTDRVVRFTNTEQEPERLSGTTWQVSFVLQAREQKILEQLEFYTKAYGVDENTGSDFMSIIDNYYTRD